ncbi:MAG: sulfatase [Bacillota bacterium]
MMGNKNNDKMNVLFIVVDDLRTQLGCYGHEEVISPNIDQLAQSGVLFERAYCQQAICAPSRASVLSGYRPDSTKIYGLDTPVREALPEVLTLPEQFKKNGYETVSVGKVYHHNSDDLQGWSKKPIWSSGDWRGRGYLTDEALEQAKNNEDCDLGPAFEAVDVPDDAYPDGKDALAAMGELERLKEQDKPFFLAMGFHKPHLPFNAPQKYWDLYQRDEIQLADNPFEPENATRYSITNFMELRRYFGMPMEGPVPDDLARKLIHGYNACVSYVDAQLGKLLDHLESLDLKDNTLIVLWGDHGWKLGEHACWCKHTNFENDTCAPLIFRVPGMEKNRKTPSLAEFVDIYPTLCELCGLEIPEHLEGDSLVPILKNTESQVKEAAFSQYPRGKVMGYTVRTDRYRYVQWQNRETKEVEARELYHHKNDPQENVNVAEQNEYQDDINELKNLLETSGAFGEIK